VAAEGLHQDVAERGGLYRSGQNRPSGGIRGQLAQELVAGAATDDMDDLDLAVGHGFDLVEHQAAGTGQGTLLSGGAGSLTGTLAGVLLLGVIQNLINQVGTLSSYYQQVVSGAFLIVVVVVQTYLSRRRRL
jgi:predicted ABC-type sugar transport system permease subunit